MTTCISLLHDPVALGGLAVSLAGLVWTVYQDLKKMHDRPLATQITIRTVRIELHDDQIPKQLDAEQRDQIIQAAVEETIRIINEETAPPRDQ